jgi:hypothetical protein
VAVCASSLRPCRLHVLCTIIPLSTRLGISHANHGPSCSEYGSAYSVRRHVVALAMFGQRGWVGVGCMRPGRTPIARAWATPNLGVFRPHSCLKCPSRQILPPTCGVSSFRPPPPASNSCGRRPPKPLQLAHTTKHLGRLAVQLGQLDLGAGSWVRHRDLPRRK